MDSKAMKEELGIVNAHSSRTMTQVTGPVQDMPKPKLTIYRGMGVMQSPHTLNWWVQDLNGRFIDWATSREDGMRVIDRFLEMNPHRVNETTVGGRLPNHNMD